VEGIINRAVAGYGAVVAGWRDGVVAGYGVKLAGWRGGAA